MLSLNRSVSCVFVRLATSFPAPSQPIITQQVFTTPRTLLSELRASLLATPLQMALIGVSVMLGRIGARVDQPSGQVSVLGTAWTSPLKVTLSSPPIHEQSSSLTSRKLGELEQED
ncbi:hypothetical protein RRG08_055355 [Elysia crispata]|uniref:Uncharacterized protein n=1 Tax=Elysia crispata TaxID=231223 RepID=A0AAE1E421_9GAST|nr:hypothetical protein RRG08_055355 [Elysia crispata]